MRLLLDTHIFIWFVAGDPQLSARLRQLIEDTNNENGSAWQAFGKWQ